MRRRHAATAARTKSAPRFSKRSACCAPRSSAAIHRFDGAEQYFTRAVDFGFSFSVDETFEKWGRDEILGDYVRLIRTIRPDVITGLTPTGTGGGQHHQASAILAHEAFKAAADPTKYPEQIKEGLRAWQPQKFYFTVGFSGSREPASQPSKQLTINLTGYDQLLGRTYAEVGTEARSMHKCQGQAQLLSLPGPASISYQLAESTLPAESEATGHGAVRRHRYVDCRASHGSRARSRRRS